MATARCRVAACMAMKSPAVSSVARADFSHCWQGVISAALPARRGCPELQREPTLKLGNSPYFFNTHFEKQRFSSPFPWRADNGYF
jgi:hypothetical protein